MPQTRFFLKKALGLKKKVVVVVNKIDRPGARPEEVIDEVLAAGLRGRGGAGFPSGRKWSFAAANAADQKYVVCNGDEGDPGAFMDGSVMEGDPYKLIEGMMIAAYAVKAENGYIYVRAEYPNSVARLRMAIAQMEEKGLLGDNILGSDFSFHMHINRGAGAFVCGEGSALTASIEGSRGMPRTKPPRTVEKGLWERPTVLNNVETYANVPKIILEGADWLFEGVCPIGRLGIGAQGKARAVGQDEVDMVLLAHGDDRVHAHQTDSLSVGFKFLEVVFLQPVIDGLQVFIAQGIGGN